MAYSDLNREELRVSQALERLDRQRDSLLAKWRHRHPGEPLPQPREDPAAREREMRYQIALSALSLIGPAPPTVLFVPPQPNWFQPLPQQYQQPQNYCGLPNQQWPTHCQQQGNARPRKRIRRRNRPGPGRTPPGHSSTVRNPQIGHPPALIPAPPPPLPPLPPPTTLQPSQPPPPPAEGPLAPPSAKEDSICTAYALGKRIKVEFDIDV